MIYRFARRLSTFFRAADGAYAAAALSSLVLLVAVWHAFDYSTEFDPEFPGLQRDHFSPYAPFAYRIAEPGDTLDLIALYLGAIGLGLLLAERIRANASARPANRLALNSLITGLLLTGVWAGCAPDPPADGWHGLSFQAIGRAGTPAIIRLVLVGIASTIALLVFIPLVARGRALFRGASPQWRVLAIVSGVFALWRVAGIPDPEPWGYWPRWGMVISLIIADVALASRVIGGGELPRWTLGAKSLRAASIAVTALIIIQAGFYVHWLHWPIPRLKVVVPGKIYASAMPPPDGLALAHSRHGFKTIINLFNEDTPQRHRDYPAEVAFAAKHGIRYVRADGSSQGVDFVRNTLEVVRNPDNWPVLVHCHGNMDRTPAWVGIYRFIDLGWPMRDVLATIERHRGYRPKGGVTVLYEDVIPALAPERFRDDPVACRIARYAREYEEKQKSEIAAKQAESSRK